MCRSGGKVHLVLAKTKTSSPIGNTPSGENNSTQQQKRTTQLGSRNETTQLVSRNETTQLNRRKQLNSSVGTKQLNSALPSTACNRLQPPTTAYNRLQPPAPPAPPLQQNRLFLPTNDILFD
ncbi:hypothetical protein TNCV_5057691 [Trichonephila clavipes]|nr:hypothetical protein TNCV_5057691 [Trichonephila clavipes]